jgi:2'-5' RNA ligase
VRLFVALEVPDAWRDIARQTTAAVAQASGVRLRAVDPALMHLTLRFLGEVPDERVPALMAGLEAAVPSMDIALELTTAGTFGPAARTSVVWLGIGGDLDGLQAVAARIELAVHEAGLPPEDRPLRVHLTLARLARQLGSEERRAVAEAVRRLDPPPALPFRAREAVLVRSYLGGPQPRYEVLARSPQAGADTR